MARIAGVDLPNKHVDVALTYIFGHRRHLGAEDLRGDGRGPREADSTTSPPTR